MWVIALFLGINLSNPLGVLVGLGGVSLTSLFTYIFVYNIFLAVFNLLPAFPMDGGRVFRSLLAMKLDYVKATRIAASVGRGLAVLMGIYGLFNGGIFLILIAIFIYSGATQEEQMVRLRGSLRGYKVQQAYTPSAYQLSPYHNLQHVVDFMLISGQSSFPVSQGELYVGFLTRAKLEQALQTRGPHTWISDVMRRDVLPVSLSTDIYAGTAAAGWGTIGCTAGGGKRPLRRPHHTGQYSRTIPALPHRPRRPPQNPTGVRIKSTDDADVTDLICCHLCNLWLIRATDVVFHIRFVNLPQFCVQIR